MQKSDRFSKLLVLEILLVLMFLMEHLREDVKSVFHVKEIRFGKVTLVLLRDLRMT